MFIKSNDNEMNLHDMITKNESLKSFLMTVILWKFIMVLSISSIYHYEPQFCPIIWTQWSTEFIFTSLIV